MYIADDRDSHVRRVTGRARLDFPGNLRAGNCTCRNDPALNGRNCSVLFNFVSGMFQPRLPRGCTVGHVASWSVKWSHLLFTESTPLIVEPPTSRSVRYEL